MVKNTGSGTSDQCDTEMQCSASSSDVITMLHDIFSILGFFFFSSSSALDVLRCTSRWRRRSTHLWESTNYFKIQLIPMSLAIFVETKIHWYEVCVLQQDSSLSLLAWFLYLQWEWEFYDFHKHTNTVSPSVSLNLTSAFIFTTKRIWFQTITNPSIIRILIFVLFVFCVILFLIPPNTPLVLSHSAPSVHTCDSCL